MTETVFRTGRRRLFSASPLADGATELKLDDASAHYLTRVLRLRPGTAVDVADGSGRLWQGELDDADGAWWLRDLRVIHEEALGPERVLVAALLKGDRWEWMLEKAAELGVSTIVPVNAARSVVTLDAKNQAKRLSRWTTIVEGAARQCERLAPVHVEAPTSLEDAIARYPDATRLMLDETTPKNPWSRRLVGKPIVLFVGPEGGWTDEERALLRAAPAHACGLGANVLRAETAAIAALTIVRALEDELIGRDAEDEAASNDNPAL